MFSGIARSNSCPTDREDQEADSVKTLEVWYNECVEDRERRREDDATQGIPRPMGKRGHQAARVIRRGQAGQAGKAGTGFSSTARRERQAPVARRAERAGHSGVSSWAGVQKYCHNVLLKKIRENIKFWGEKMMDSEFHMFQCSTVIPHSR